MEQSELFDRPEAERLRDEGMTLAEEASRVQQWKLNAEAWRYEKPIGFLFTSDDLTFSIGLPDKGQNRNNVVGATIMAWSKAKQIIPTGRYLKSSRITRHAAI